MFQQPGSAGGVRAPSHQNHRFLTWGLTCSIGVRGQLQGNLKLYLVIRDSHSLACVTSHLSSIQESLGEHDLKFHLELPDLGVGIPREQVAP
jgi:hypothetical protein